MGFIPVRGETMARGARRWRRLYGHRRAGRARAIEAARKPRAAGRMCALQTGIIRDMRPLP